MLDTVSVFFNDRISNSFNDLRITTSPDQIPDWSTALINIIKSVEKLTGLYERVFRTRLSKLVRTIS